jgi:GntR family transcriptional regulator, transcriptional repressor for pyruvate dehydrogenase complex
MTASGDEDPIEGMNMVFTDISRNRVSDQIKDVLKQAILKGEFKPGDKLPREDQIAASFKVSKVSVREALRDLESEGIIEKRRGAFGGNFVAQPGISKMNDLMTNYYQFGTVTPEEVLDFGQMLEPTLVAAAVNRRTGEDLKKMLANINEREACAAAGKVSGRLVLEFHGIIADSCQNQLCSVVWHALMGVSVNLLKNVLTPEDFKTHLIYSKELYECMLAQDESAAQSSMLRTFEKFIEIHQRAKNKEVCKTNPHPEP